MSDLLITVQFWFTSDWSLSPFLHSSNRFTVCFPDLGGKLKKLENKRKKLAIITVEESSKHIQNPDAFGFWRSLQYNLLKMIELAIEQQIRRVAKRFAKAAINSKMLLLERDFHSTSGGSCSPRLVTDLPTDVADSLAKAKRVCVLV